MRNRVEAYRKTQAFGDSDGDGQILCLESRRMEGEKEAKGAIKDLEAFGGQMVSGHVGKDLPFTRSAQTTKACTKSLTVTKGERYLEEFSDK